MSESSVDRRRLCRFSLKELVRVDFVFPYGRVAASKDGLVPEPFDRDADHAINSIEMEEMKSRISGLFK